MRSSHKLTESSKFLTKSGNVNRSPFKEEEEKWSLKIDDHSSFHTDPEMKEDIPIEDKLEHLDEDDH